MRSINTFDHVALDGLDRHHLHGVLVPTSEDLSELPVPDLVLQYILIDYLGHAQYRIKYNNNANTSPALPALPRPLATDLPHWGVLQRLTQRLLGLLVGVPLLLRLEPMHHMQHK